MKTITVFIVAIGILLLALFVLFKIVFGEKRKIKSLEAELKSKQKCIDELYKNAQQLAELRADADKKKEELENAKTDEEIISVIASIISDNNKLCNNDKRRSNSSSRTSAENSKKS